MAVGDERSPAWLEHVDKRRKEVMAVAAEAEQQHNQSNAEDPVASVDAEPEEDEPVAQRQRPQHNRVTSSQDREKDARARAMGSQQDTQLQTSSSPQASRGVKRKQQSRETSSAHSESASDSELQVHGACSERGTHGCERPMEEARDTNEHSEYMHARPLADVRSEHEAPFQSRTQTLRAQVHGANLERGIHGCEQVMEETRDTHDHCKHTNTRLHVDVHNEHEAPFQESSRTSRPQIDGGIQSEGSSGNGAESGSRGVKRKQSQCASDEATSGGDSRLRQRPAPVESSHGGASADDGGEDVQLPDSALERSEESRSVGSLKDMLDDGSFHGEEEAIDYAARNRLYEEEESEAQADYLARHLTCLRAPSENVVGEPIEAASVDGSRGDNQPNPAPPDAVDMGTHWFSRGCEDTQVGPQERALMYMKAQGHRVLAAGDVREDTATKRYTTFSNVKALQAYDNNLAEYAIERNMYEVLYPDLPTRLYFDIEYSVAEQDDANFMERYSRFSELRAAFFSQVLGLPTLLLRFQTSTAHGGSKGGYKHSVHDVLEGFCVADHAERLLFKECFDAFLRDPPTGELGESIHFLDYEHKGKNVRIWDSGVYTKFRCFRILGSCKKGSARPLVPAEGSSKRLMDHLVGLYDETEKSILKKIDLTPAREYMATRALPVSVERIRSGSAPAGALVRESRLQPKEKAVLNRIREQLEVYGDSTSRFDHKKGGLYCFRVSGERTCPYGAKHRGANNFAVLLCGNKLEYKCNSSECERRFPRFVIGELSVRDRLVGSTMAAVDRLHDLSVYQKYTKAFVDNWAFQGDRGGSRIFSRMYSCLRIVHTDGGWYMWNGRFYCQEKESRVSLVVMEQLSQVYERLHKDINEALCSMTDKEEIKRLKSKQKMIRNYNFSKDVDSTMRVLTGELHVHGFESELDKDPHILNVANGVVNLRSGELDIHRPQYLCTQIAATAYKGLHHPAPTIESFFNDIFNGDTEIINYLQRLLGYGITGMSNEEKICFFVGKGGNGKGALKVMLEKLLGPFCGVLQSDIIVTTPGQRPAARGAASPGVSAMKGKRMSITDETKEGQEVDEGSLKAISGGGTTSSRILYGQLEDFELMNLIIVMTNFPPVMRNPNDDAMLRRLLYVHFPNLYVSPEKFDPANPQHRLVDTDLKSRIVEKGSLEQLLSYLVRGAVEWYEQGGLGRTPRAMQASLSQYLANNDKVQTFIDDHCTVGRELRAPVTDFLKDYRAAMSDREMLGETLTKQMEEKGYMKKKRETADQYGKRPVVYVGIKSDYER